MNSSHRNARALRLPIVLIVGILAVAGGFFAFRASIAQLIVQTSAQQAFGSQRFNILLLGYQEDEGNSDTMLVAHFDIDRRTATLVSVPRDSWVAIPGHGHEKINAAIGLGGPELSARIVADLIGAPIDATIALRPADAKQIVDAMGGLNVNVDEDMNYDDNAGNLHIHLRKGEQYLTGGQVLEYIRFRHDATSDWGRVHRQQQVLKSLLDQISQPQQWAKLPRILAFAAKGVKTNLSQMQMAALLQIYRGVPDDNVRTFTMPARAGWVGEASVVFIDEQWAKRIGRLLFSKQEPPQDEVLVANATGNAGFDKTIVAALRGGGWNVRRFVDQAAKPAGLAGRA
jgi:LCP family protein required for cell wall assembly